MLNSNQHDISSAHKNKMLTSLQILRCCIFHANKCQNTNNYWHFNIFERDKVSFFVELNMKKIVQPRGHNWKTLGFVVVNFL